MLQAELEHEGERRPFHAGLGVVALSTRVEPLHRLLEVRTSRILQLNKKAMAELCPALKMVTRFCYTLMKYSCDRRRCRQTTSR